MARRSKRCPMSWRATQVVGLATVVFSFWPATVAQADDQQLVQDYLASRGVSGAVVRPITDDYVGRTFPNISFFGVIFRQYPVAVQCPPAQDLKCSNVFFVKDGSVDFVATLPDLKFFFSVEMDVAPTADPAGHAVSPCPRCPEELT